MKKQQQKRPRQPERPRPIYSAIDISELDVTNKDDDKALLTLINNGSPIITARGRHCIAIEKELAKKVIATIKGYKVEPGLDGTQIIRRNASK